MSHFAGILGMLVILALAYAFSTNRRAIKLKTILWGLGLQLLLGFFVLRSTTGTKIFAFLGNGANKLLSYSYAGSEFVFGDIGFPKELSRLGFSFAFQVLPTIIFIAAFFAVLYHIGVMQLIIRGADQKNLLTAVIMTAPGTLLMAKMLVPETEQPLTAGRVEMPQMEKESNILGAIARGTTDGLHLALNVGAMLITFIALLALLNAMMGGIHSWPHMAWFPASLQTIFGWIFAPVAWLIGIPWHDAPKIGNLLGTRMVINQFVAFRQLGPIKGSLDPRSFMIATFALCGFVNFNSIRIQIAGNPAPHPAP